jgi:hypothetical protein
MSPRILALGVLVALSATSVAANATPAGGVLTIYDNITNNSGSFNDGYTGYGPTTSTEVATEFRGANVTLYSIKLALSATNPNDGGSVSIYLIPNSANFQATGSLGGATALATIQDSALTTTPPDGYNWPAATTVYTAPDGATTPSLGTGDYWIVVEGANSSFNWFLGSDVVPATGTALLTGNNASGWGVLDPTTVSGPGPFIGYGAEVTGIPEPTTIALLGVGLAGLGYSRRRKVA